MPSFYTNHNLLLLYTYAYVYTYRTGEVHVWVIQYPPLAVPIPSADGIAMTADLDSYTDDLPLGVEIQTACQTEQRCERERYRKSATDC